MFGLVCKNVASIFGSDCCVRNKQEEEHDLQQHNSIMQSNNYIPFNNEILLSGSQQPNQPMRSKQSLEYQTYYNQNIDFQDQDEFQSQIEREDVDLFIDSSDNNNFINYNNNRGEIYPQLNNQNHQQQYLEAPPKKYKEVFREKRESSRNTSSSMANQASTKEGQKLSSKKNVKNWNTEEDLILRNAYEKSPGNWKFISEQVETRSSQQCQQRWRRIQPENKNRKPWTKEEDEIVLRMVQQGDEKERQWGHIAGLLGKGRTGKQVRERYLNVLDTSINKGKWTQEEDAIVVEQFFKIGPKWSEISTHLKGRPENMVKNRFYSHIKKELNQNIKRDYEEEIRLQILENQELQQQQNVQYIDPVVSTAHTSNAILSSNPDINAHQQQQHHHHSLQQGGYNNMKILENDENIIKNNNNTADFNQAINNDYLPPVQEKNSKFLGDIDFEEEIAEQDERNNFGDIKLEENDDIKFGGQQSDIGNQQIAFQNGVNTNHDNLNFDQTYGANSKIGHNGNGHFIQLNSNISTNSRNYNSGDNHLQNYGQNINFQLSGLSNGSNHNLNSIVAQNRNPTDWNGGGNGLLGSYDKLSNKNSQDDPDHMYFGVTRPNFNTQPNQFKKPVFKLSESISSGSQKSWKPSHEYAKSEFKEPKDLSTKELINNLMIKIDRAKANNNSQEIEDLGHILQNLMKTLPQNQNNSIPDQQLMQE